MDNSYESDVKINVEVGGLPAPSVQDVQAFRARKRSHRFARLALILFFTFICFTHFVRIRSHISHSCHKVISKLSGPWNAPATIPIPPSIELVDCPEWSTSPDDKDDDLLHSVLSLDLPLDSDELFFLTTGALSHGTVVFYQDTEQSDSNVATVTVDWKYRFAGLPSHVKVCSVERKDVSASTAGLGIFSSRLVHQARHHGFVVRVGLPKTTDPLVLNKFTTDMPLFVHYVADLSDVVFPELTLHTVNSPIFVKAITASEAHIETTNAAIRGTFNSTSSLELVTVNAPINVSVGLRDLGDNEDPVTVKLSTVNAKIVADVSLEAGKPADLSLLDSSASSHFKIDAHTANAPVDIVVPVAPEDAEISLIAHTMFGAAHAALPDTFEGALSVKTFFSPATVHFNDSLSDDDPSVASFVDDGAEYADGDYDADDDDDGEAASSFVGSDYGWIVVNGKRTLELRRVSPSAVEGAIGASEEGKARGYVELETSFAPAVLDL
ncbi:hypothetical protein FISHEDRAFT_68397 [Fistulina hepatica ATCC 64428]|uniref:DUF7330 domain-containing protein n=1 Tax=Fistulina hepatica ATCC 64428 TaxID=1128425 RepID=A0A0D7AT76_9AGAR|nr:hypothetical protein FISHEDRAFT_68397 [Fistulina hepatica ATCC 64428]